MYAFTRSNTEFRSQGLCCRAWHYQPRRAAKPTAGGPAIVMAHGLGGTRDADLEPFADFLWACSAARR